jgi:hypothetical protein
VPARLPKEILSACHRDQFRNPVATGHQRFQPFDCGHSRRPSIATRGTRNFVHSGLQMPDKSGASRFTIARGGDQANIAPEVGKRVRFKRDNSAVGIQVRLHRALYIVQTDRTDFALRLGHYVGRR